MEHRRPRLWYPAKPDLTLYSVARPEAVAFGRHSAARMEQGHPRLWYPAK